MADAPETTLWSAEAEGRYGGTGTASHGRGGERAGVGVRGADAFPLDDESVGDRESAGSPAGEGPARSCREAESSPSRQEFRSSASGTARRSDIEMGAQEASDAEGEESGPAKPRDCSREGLSWPSGTPASAQGEREASARGGRLRATGTLLGDSGLVTLPGTHQPEDDSPVWFAWVSELFAGLRQHSGKSIKYNLVHVLRRVVFVLVAMHFHERPWVQTLAFVVQSEIAMMLILSVRPFACPMQNAVETFNEVAVLITGYHMMVVTGYNIPALARDRVGISSIVCIVALIVVNVLRWCVHIVQTVRLYGKRLQHRHRARRAVQHRKVAEQTQKELALASVETERGLLDHPGARVDTAEQIRRM